MNIRQPLHQGASIGVDASLCGQGPIHVPDAIQPHGAMLVALVDGGLISHASANLAAILGRPAEAVLGQKLQRVIGEAACRVLCEASSPDGTAPRQRVFLLPGPDGATLQLRSYRSGRHLCVDIEPMRRDAPQELAVSMLQSVLETFNDAATCGELCDLAVRGLMTIAGYDRVMAYRFDKDGNGEVIAEACVAGLDPYLGQRHAAADIPPQARQQYLRQRVGAIADAGCRPVLLLTDPASDDHAPLDLTDSTLCSASPVQRESMRRMNTAASLTIGLAHGPHLWGMLVCHHTTPRVAGPELRAVADMIGQVVSLLLGSLAEAEALAAELFEVRHYDSLTGLPNRKLLQERLVEAGAETGATATLLFLDLDGTKEVNETVGYAAGDLLLIEMARRLVAAAGPENFAARLGGDEFVVLCRDLQPDAVDELREHIRRAIKAPFEIFGRLCHVSPDIGTAVVDQSSDLDLVGAANFAMQAAKITIEAKHKAETQRQKMETIGRTMGGVAHEINNMLQPVTLLVQDVIDKKLVVGDGKEHLDIVLDCTKKARQIIGDMLAFSSPTASTTEIHDPAELLHDSLPIVRQAIPPDLILLIRIEGCLPPIKINRTAFVQILLNLAINGAAAMNGQGELTIGLEEEVRGIGGGLGQQTSYARLRVIDNGCGMDKATLDRAFEPFFTTKPVGQGTGLGLPVVHGLVREMGATIALVSEPDCGTTVTILIPGHNGE